MSKSYRRHLRRVRGRCTHDGKTNFPSWEAAWQLIKTNEDPGRVYWCPYGGGYHLTLSSQSDYDRARAGAQ